jgi:predicted nucleotidyltransferase component of viral defense system
MIDVAEVVARARKLGLDREHVERDHLMCCFLAAIADGGSPLVFRGGTALARAYWPDFRLSEDLDFISGSSAAQVQASLERAVAVAARVAGIDLVLDFGRPKGGWSRSYVRFDQASILIDVNLGEEAYLAVEDCVIDLPYSDLRDSERKLPVVALAEILGNKWFMLGDDDRREPRDLYDVWAGLIRFDVPFSELARGHRAKYG